MSGLLGQINPGLLLVLVGFVGCLIPVQRVRQALMVGTPIVAMLLQRLYGRQQFRFAFFAHAREFA